MIDLLIDHMPWYALNANLNDLSGMSSSAMIYLIFNNSIFIYSFLYPYPATMDYHMVQYIIIQIITLPQT